MTDLELLELAAKAAGELTTDWYGNAAYFDGVLKRWNPLADDGDAFRLAVKCLPFHTLSYTREDYELCNEDGLAATRRAIVRAAAELGKTL